MLSEFNWKEKSNILVSSFVIYEVLSPSMLPPGGCLRIGSLLVSIAAL